MCRYRRPSSLTVNMSHVTPRCTRGSAAAAEWRPTWRKLRAAGGSSPEARDPLRVLLCFTTTVSDTEATAPSRPAARIDVAATVNPLKVVLMGGVIRLAQLAASREYKQTC